MFFSDKLPPFLILIFFSCQPVYTDVVEREWERGEGGGLFNYLIHIGNKVLCSFHFFSYHILSKNYEKMLEALLLIYVNNKENLIEIAKVLGKKCVPKLFIY